MTGLEQPEQFIRMILDAGAIGEYGRSEHVGEVISRLGQVLAISLDVVEDDLPGVPAFGLPVLSLSTALERAPDKESQDLILGLIAHPWCVILAVEPEQIRRLGDLGWENPLPDWTAEIGSQQAAHAVVCAIDHDCVILTKTPEDYALDQGDGEILDGLLVRIPRDGDDWPDARDYWPVD